MALLHTAAITRLDGRYAIEALSAAGPTDLPNGWVHVLGAGVADDVLGAYVVAGLNEADRPLPGERLTPAADAFGCRDDAALAEQGAVRVIAEYNGDSVLILTMSLAGPRGGFVLAEDATTAEVLADDPPQVLGQVIRRALDDAMT